MPTANPPIPCGGQVGRPLHEKGGVMRLLVTLTALLVVLGLSAPAESKIPAVRQPHSRPARLDSTTEDTRDEVRFHHMIYTIQWKQAKEAKHRRQARRLRR